MWERALELAKFRNRIAHNPLVFVWEGENTDGSPKYIGLPDLKGGWGNQGPSEGLHTLQALQEKVREVLELTQQFEAILPRVLAK
jgi:hypothetical protein